MKNHLLQRCHLTFLIVFLSTLTVTSHAQLITVGNDTTICPGQSVTLTATVSSVSGTAPTQIGFGSGCSFTYDDAMSCTWIPIGFNFTYYGNTYTQCLVASNGYIQFSGNTPGGYSPWAINTAIPSAAVPVNSIMAPWQDIYPQGNAIVRYKTIGNAPNRIFIVEYLDIPMFSCTNFCFGNQIMLYESTNVIETHIAFKQICQNWNNGYAIHGIQNINGSIAHVVPGRNFPNVWAATADGKRWTPNGNNVYTITTIPFSPVYMPAVLNNNSITWFANGVQIGTGISINVTPNQTTTYVARLNYSSCGQVSFFSDTLVVTVGSLIVNAGPDINICEGGSAQLNVTGSFTNPSSITWTPAGSLSNPNIANPVATPSQPTTYTVSVTEGQCTGSDQVNVNFWPQPAFTLNPQNPTICYGDSIQLVCVGAQSFQWSPATGLSNTTSNNTMASPQVTTTYTITGTTANGCVGDTTMTVTVNPLPVVSVNPPSHAMCFGDDVMLTATGAQTYSWSPASYLSGTNTDVVQAEPQSTSTYTVIGTDVNGCRDTADVTITINPLPVVNINSNIVSGCSPIVVNFSDNSTVANGGNAIAWLWDIEGYGLSQAQNPVVSYTTPGIYDVSLIVITDNGCIDSASVPNMIEVFPLPLAAFQIQPSETLSMANPTAQFIDASEVDTGSIAAWDWTFDVFGTSTYNNPTFTFFAPGEYSIALIVTTDKGCMDTAYGKVVLENISEIFIPNTFTPNGDGINDTFFPVVSNPKTVDIELEIYDRWGVVIYKSKSYMHPWNGFSNEDTRCPQGVYAYKIFYRNEIGKESTYMGNVNLVR